MNPTIDKQLIQHPEATDLSLRIRPSEASVQVMLHTPGEDNSLIFREVPLDPAAATPLSALEDAIYDNPALLSEFRSVSICYASPHFVVVPDHFDESLQEKSLRKMFPATDDDSTALRSPIPRAKATLVFDIPRIILNFFRRTFDRPSISHPLATLADYFLSQNPRPAIPKIYANLRDGFADIVIIGQDASLRYANAIRYRQPIDALYFILASRRLMLPDDPKPEILLCGALADRNAVAQLLTENSLDPLTVGCPASMFRAGREALNAPFDLITLPLCV